MRRSSLPGITAGSSLPNRPGILLRLSIAGALLAVVISLWLPQSGYAYGISVTILSDPTQEESYYGSECRSVSVSEGTSSARAAPFNLLARSSSSGGPGNAFAYFYEMVITVQDRQKFLNLIPAGQNYLDLLLNVNLAITVNTPLHKLPFGVWAVSTTDASLGLSGGPEACFVETLGGHITHEIDWVDVITEYTGFFAGIPVGGANQVVSLPVRICRPVSSTALPSLTILTGDVSSQNDSVDSYAQSSIRMWLMLNDNLLTLPNGTPLASLGISYTVQPACPNGSLNAPGNFLLLD